MLRGPGGRGSESAESFPELARPSPLRPPPLSPAPKAFTGPKVHAHRAQLGRWGLLSPGTKGLQRVVGRIAGGDGVGEGSRPRGSAAAARASRPHQARMAAPRETIRPAGPA